jgi:Leucine-rich repeat (LRR) protein
LKSLNLSNNKLTSIPKKLPKNLNKLTTLRVNNNCLTNVPDNVIKEWLDSLNPGWDEEQGGDKCSP